jgi:hypothetical protein
VGNFIMEAGWGIWPVIGFGLASLGFAAKFVRTRERNAFYALLGTAVLTLLAGALGTFTGLQAAAQYIANTNEKWLFIVGLREALNNMTLALAVVIVDAMVVTLCFVRGAGGAGVAQRARVEST